MCSFFLLACVCSLAVCQVKLDAPEDGGDGYGCESCDGIDGTVGSNLIDRLGVRLVMLCCQRVLLLDTMYVNR